MIMMIVIISISVLCFFLLLINHVFKSSTDDDRKNGAFPASSVSGSGPISPGSSNTRMNKLMKFAGKNRVFTVFDCLFLVKNSLLYTDLNAKLEAVRAKIEALKQPCRSFLEEKLALEVGRSTLVKQLQETNKNLNDLNKNLHDSNAKSKTVEDMCQLVMEEKVLLMPEKDGLASNTESGENALLLEKIEVLERQNSMSRSYLNALATQLQEKNKNMNDLRYENYRLKETCQRESSEKEACLVKNSIIHIDLKASLVKNSIMQIGLNAELKAAKGKIEDLEQSCRSFLEEKSSLEGDRSTLVTQLKKTNEFLKLLLNNSTVHEKFHSKLHCQSEDSKAEKIEENLSFKLQRKVNEIKEMEILGASIFGELHYSRVIQLVYEHKFHELSDVVDDYMDQNVVLKTQLAAYGPQIILLNECISSLENQMISHDAEITKDQRENILNEDCSESTITSDLHSLTARLQAIVKAAAKPTDLMVQENNTINQLEFRQSNQNGSSQRPTSEITSEGENILVLDQISNSSSYGLNTRQHQLQPLNADNQMVKHCETSDTVSVSSSSMKVTEKNMFYRLKWMKKQKSSFSTKVDEIKARERMTLRDYLYGVEEEKKKKAKFWACIRPSTDED